MFHTANTNQDAATLTPYAGNPVLKSADPRRTFPGHVISLTQHLVAAGEDPKQWHIMEAAETRLDEEGMEVRFTLIRRYPAQQMMCRWVLIGGGKTISIRNK